MNLIKSEAVVEIEEKKKDPSSVFYLRRPTKEEVLEDWKRIAANHGTSGLVSEHFTHKDVVNFKTPNDYSFGHKLEIYEKQVRARFRLIVYATFRDEIIAIVPEAP